MEINQSTDISLRQIFEKHMGRGAINQISKLEGKLATYFKPLVLYKRKMESRELKKPSPKLYC